MISVIVPVYNVEPYLCRCIDSIIAQTYKDLEIILVDDGSPDNCGAICDEYAVKDSRVKVIHKKNGGLSSARNAGLVAATGEYIAFVDSDDWIDCTMYAKMVQLAAYYDADIVECGYRWVKPDKTLDDKNNRSVDVYSNLEALNMLYFGDQMFGGISIVAWNKIYRKMLFDEIRYPEGFIHEDVGTTPKLIYLANRVVKINQNFYNFFFSPNSISRSPYSISCINIIDMRYSIMTFFEQKGLLELRDYMEGSYMDSIIYNYCECFARRDIKPYQEALKSLIDRFRTDYKKATISKNVTVCRSWRNKLFRVCPQLYYVLRDVKRRMSERKI